MLGGGDPGESEGWVTGVDLVSTANTGKVSIANTGKNSVH